MSRTDGAGQELVRDVAARLPAVAAAAALLLATTGADAEDLRDVAARVERAWRAAGAAVARRDARFVMEDETTTIDVRPDAAARDRDGDCLRVALIGARGMSFHVTGVGGLDDDSVSVASAAGVVELHGCGLVPDVVRLRSDSGRGALEVVIASGTNALPPVSAILLERTGGTLPAAPDPGPLPPLPLPKARAAAAEARLLADGFVIVPAVTWTAGDDGKGGHDLTIDAGCHRIELFAPEPQARELPGRDGVRRSRLDLDGAIRKPDGEVIVEDQTIASDVRLDTCVGASTRIRVTFEGAPRAAPVLVSHAIHPLPSHLPGAWTPDLRARVAGTFVAHHAASPHEDAVLLARGASGNTPVPIDLEPGACYVAVAAMDRAAGRGHGVSLRVTTGSRVAQDDQGAREDAALVAFCAREESFGRVEVDARSAATGWSAAVFRMLGGAWQVSP